MLLGDIYVKKEVIEKLNEKEIKVYRYILAHSLEFPFMTIREVANGVQVSTTVILNFVKRWDIKVLKNLNLPIVYKKESQEHLKGFMMINKL